MSSATVDDSHISSVTPHDDVQPRDDVQPCDDVQPRDETKSRIGSALTIENVKTFEEETGSVDVAELLSKNAISSAAEEIIDILSDNIKSSEIYEEDEDEPLTYATPDKPMSPISDVTRPARRQVTRGHKFTGEEYVAVSIDVQTDESWIGELGYWKKDEKPSQHAAVKNQAKYATDSDEEVLQSTEKANDSNEKSFKDMEAEFLEDEFSSETKQKEIKTALNFNESDSVFEDYQYIVPNVGPPKILQYKAESKIKHVDYEAVKTTFPGNVDLNNLSQEEQEYYLEILDEIKDLTERKRQTESGKLIDIVPHSAFGASSDSKIEKENEAERSRQREIEKQRQSFAANETNFYAFARQLKTVNYALSSEKCMEDGWTIRPVTPVPSLKNEQTNFVDEIAADILSGKKLNSRFIYKQYHNESPFLAIFPDGTGNVWYRSGNPAISVIASEKSGKLSFIAQQDKCEESHTPNILAIFSANGKCVCYYPNGSLMMLLSPLGGEYFNDKGLKLKQWKWWGGLKEHVHAPPFQPITFTLSKHLAVRVLSQDSIYVTFMDRNKSVRFNCGTKLMLPARNKLPKIDAVDVERAELEEKVLYVRMILERVNYLLQYPNVSRSNKIKLPYLAGKNKRTLQKKVDNIGHLPPIRRPLQRKKFVARKALKLPKFYKTNTISTDISEANNDLQPLVTVN